MYIRMYICQSSLTSTQISTQHLVEKSAWKPSKCVSNWSQESNTTPWLRTAITCQRILLEKIGSYKNRSSLSKIWHKTHSSVALVYIRPNDEVPPYIYKSRDSTICYSCPTVVQRKSQNWPIACKNCCNNKPKHQTALPIGPNPEIPQ